MSNDSTMRKAGLFAGVCWLVFTVSWLANGYKLATQDFDSPYKGEVVHAIGVIVPPASLITVWFD